MAYERQTFSDGDTLTADNMNHIEAGLKAADELAQKVAATEADNGKFLRVVDGVATWVTITNAEEGSF